MKTKLASKLPIQDMLRSVLSNATEKLAADERSQSRIRDLVTEKTASSKSGVEKTASLTSPDFIEKLAAACDHIAANIDHIETPPKSVLKQASEEGSPAGAGKGPGALEVNKSIGGTQQYKKDKPKTEDAAASQAGSPLSNGGQKGGKTQLDNNMHDAPGGGSIEPTGKYPEKGPLVAGPSVKHAGVRETYIAAMSGQTKTASPADKAKAHILAKLAGEDVMKANIDGGGTVSPLAGEGQLKSTDSSQASPGQAGDPVSGMGNQGRKYIQSNSAAIDMTKGDAKGPQKTQLKEVLEEPALSPATDSKLKENLRNAGSAGVKIAAAKAALQKIASAGCQCESSGECKYCQMKTAVRAKGSEKNANAMMGAGGGGMSMGGAGGMAPPSGGMGAMAEAGASAEGCQCGGTGECRVCKLKAALAAAAMGNPGGGVPVEKDSMGDGMSASPMSGQY